MLTVCSAQAVMAAASMLDGVTNQHQVLIRFVQEQSEVTTHTIEKTCC